MQRPLETPAADSATRSADTTQAADGTLPAVGPRAARRAARWIGLLLFTLIVRLGAILASGGALEGDPDGYRQLAENLAATGVFGFSAPVGGAQSVVPTAFRPPLYPLLLAPLVRQGQLAPWGPATLHVLLGLATVAGTYWVGQRLLGGWPALVAALVVAVDPLLLAQSTLVMTETLATALAIGVLVVWVHAVPLAAQGGERSQGAGGAPRAGRGRLLAAGLALGVLLAAAYLCRPTFLVWAVLLVGWLAIAGLRRDRRGAWILAAGATAVLVAVGTFWTLRNARAVGRPVWATTHGGYTLLLGNNPLFYEYLRRGPAGEAWDAEPFHEAWARRGEGDPRRAEFWQAAEGGEPSAPAAPTGSELEEDRLAYEAALASIRRERVMFLRSTLHRVVRLWSPRPLATGQRAGAAIFVVSLYGIGLLWAGLVALVRWRGRLGTAPWMAGWLLVISLTAVHSVYWSNLRMRAPAQPLLILLAAAALGRPLAGEARKTSATAADSEGGV